MREKHKNIMILGTSSGAGKSLITTGLCRIFTSDGYDVVPFKGQNMSRNSCEIGNNKKIAISQVLQAYACKKEPQSWMNPILIIPKGNGIVDIILNGEYEKTTTGEKYSSEKVKYREYLQKIYETYPKKYEICVLEGAGSPVEINIKENDIVNTSMGKIANAPFILVADIDRGGVFASIIGTYTLFNEEEKRNLKGIIINKFRGKKDILQKGIDEIERLTKTKVLGVIPYEIIDIEDEDGLISKRDSEDIKKRCGNLSFEEYREKQFEKLEKLLRENLDVDYIYKILNREETDDFCY